jgi:phosphotransferase system  glucose/maltose/N-acetylglucosamine-specific IIC component
VPLGWQAKSFSSAQFAAVSAIFLETRANERNKAASIFTPHLRPNAILTELY